MNRHRTSAITAALLVASVVAVRPALGETLPSKIERMEQELQEMKRQLQQQKEAQEKESVERRAAEQRVKDEQAAKETSRPAATTISDIADRVKIGGYGSMRYEGSDLKEQKHTFTLRRLVLTTDANIAPRLHSYIEIEYERFRKLEVERSTLGSSGGNLTAQQAIETTNGSEISLEQAWLQYDIADWINLRAGGMLVPLGRFNTNHDDNRWELPRRTLVDRGVSVLPSTAAWDELGFGLLGNVELSDDALLNYQLYVMNGVALDAEYKQKIEKQNGDTRTVTELEISPSTGGFASDVKDSKAFAGRLALSPALGHEIAGSWYYGQYTPDFLGKKDLWATAIDGRTGYGRFELEGEGMFTRFEGTRGVVTRLAQVAGDNSLVSSDPAVSTEVELELESMARNRYGYWLEARYRFWPAFLTNTFLGRRFSNPQLVAVARAEQAWLDDLVTAAEFTGGTLTSLTASNRRVDRVTVGMTYHPVPLVAFQIAYEYTQTNSGGSLAGVTNFLPAQPGEDHANIVMVGTAFGF
ncbi:MAG: hypothetical protein HY270_08665 [Deltaproteobacteria bacterium]|nr:hypothetical protein [Deltaproteobacteria bacterium]